MIRRTVNTNDVEDLVQDMFLRMFRRVGTLRDPSALRAYVLRVTSSVIVSDIRHRKVRRFLGLTHQGDLPESPGAPCDDENREALSRLYAVLHRCSHEERMSFMFKNVEGMELSEVADTLGISVATVKRRLAKVHERLTRAVGDDAQMAAALGLNPSESSVAVRVGNAAVERVLIGIESSAQASFETRLDASFAAWSRDVNRLLPLLQVVANNGPTRVGGGGRPRQLLAPPIGN